MTCSCMDDHSGRLIHYGQVFVFVDNVEWDVFGSCLQWRTLSFTDDFDQLTAAKFERRTCAGSVDEDLFLFDQFLHASTANALKVGGEVLVQTPAGVFRGCAKAAEISCRAAIGLHHAEVAS